MDAESADDDADEAVTAAEALLNAAYDAAAADEDLEFDDADAAEDCILIIQLIKSVLKQLKKRWLILMKMLQILKH